MGKCARTALAEDLSSDLSTRIRQLATARSFSSEGPLMPSSALVGISCTQPPPYFKNKILLAIVLQAFNLSTGG